MVAPTLTAFGGPGYRSSGSLSWHSSFFSALNFTVLLAAPFCLSRDHPKGEGLRSSHPCTNCPRISDQRVTTAMHTMQDYPQQTTVMIQRRSQQLPSEHTVSETQGGRGLEAIEALTSAPARQEDVRHFHDQKCNETAVAETNDTNAIQNVRGKAEAPCDSVTMRAAPHHGERLLPNDRRGARRSPEQLERAFSTAEYGGSCS